VLFRLAVLMMLFMPGRVLADCTFAEQAEKSGKISIAYMQYIYCSEEENDAEAQYKLGSMYYQGVGLSRPDFRRAAAFFSRSANNGYAPAQVKLGLLYWRGEGVEKNLKIAHKWLYLAQEPDETRWFYYVGPSSDATAGALYSKIDAAARKTVGKSLEASVLSTVKIEGETDFFEKMNIIPSYKEVAEFQHEKMIEAGKDLLSEQYQSDLQQFLNNLKPDINIPPSIPQNTQQMILNWFKPAMLTSKNLEPSKIPVLEKLKNEIESPAE